MFKSNKDIECTTTLKRVAKGVVVLARPNTLLVEIFNVRSRKRRSGLAKLEQNINAGEAQDPAGG